jgi:signal transduction histidine kinase
VRSLTIKLTLASLCTSLISVLLVGLFARYQTGVAFDRYIQDRIASEVVPVAAAYYAQHGSWAGVDVALRDAAPLLMGAEPPPPPRGIRPPGGPPPGGPLNRPYVLVDPRGRALINGRGYRVGDLVPAALLVYGAPIEVSGARVGTILAMGTTAAEVDSREQEFLRRTNRILVATSVGGGLSALIICIALTLLLTRPIRALTVALRAMRQGTLRHELPVTSRDEIGELVGAFNQLSHDLARATQLRRQMTADIAHELRTPLSVLMGYIETMRDGLLPPSQERFQTMFVEANQLQRLIDDLRLLSLADAGELSLHRQPADPEQLLATVAASYAQQAAQKQVALHVQAAARLPQVLVDQERIIQVLGNLVSNALRYTPAGGTIALSATTDHRPPTAAGEQDKETRRQGDKEMIDIANQVLHPQSSSLVVGRSSFVGGRSSVVFEVRDSGRGIPPDALPHIFERLYRADASRVDQDGGSGLGLAIVKAIVEAHGGSVTAESVAGQGTCMAVCLPLPARAAR